MYSGDIETALAALEAAVEKVTRAGAIPVVLGGDHSIAFPDAKGVANVLGHGRVSMIHFDAHADTGDIEFGSLWGHGQPMRRLIESGRAARRPVPADRACAATGPPPETLDWMAAQRMRSYEMTEIGHRGLDDVPDRGVRHRDGRVRRRVPVGRHRRLRPRARAGHRHARARRADRPASCWTPSAGSACELPVVGVDVVEVSPPYDHADITAALANRVVLEALSAIARRRRDARDGTTWDPAQPLLADRPPPHDA